MHNFSILGKHLSLQWVSPKAMNTTKFALAEAAKYEIIKMLQLSKDKVC